MKRSVLFSFILAVVCVFAVSSVRSQEWMDTLNNEDPLFILGFCAYLDNFYPGYGYQVWSSYRESVHPDRWPLQLVGSETLARQHGLIFPRTESDWQSLEPREYARFYALQNADLSGYDLTNLRLYYIDISSANLDGALLDCVLVGCRTDYIYFGSAVKIRWQEKNTRPMAAPALHQTTPASQTIVAGAATPVLTFSQMPLLEEVIALFVVHNVGTINSEHIQEMRLKNAAGDVIATAKHMESNIFTFDYVPLAARQEHVLTVEVVPAMETQPGQTVFVQLELFSMMVKDDIGQIDSYRSMPEKKILGNTFPVYVPPYDLTQIRASLVNDTLEITGANVSLALISGTYQLSVAADPGSNFFPANEIVINGNIISINTQRREEVQVYDFTVANYLQLLPSPEGTYSAHLEVMSLFKVKQMRLNFVGPMGETITVEADNFHD